MVVTRCAKQAAAEKPMIRSNDISILNHRLQFAWLPALTITQVQHCGKVTYSVTLRFRGNTKYLKQLEQCISIQGAPHMASDDHCGCLQCQLYQVLQKL